MKHTSASNNSIPQSEAPCSTNHEAGDEDLDTLTVTLSETLSLWLELIDPASAAYALADCLPPGLAQAVADGETPAVPPALFRAHYDNARALYHLGCLVLIKEQEDRDGRALYRATDAGAIVAAAMDAGSVPLLKLQSKLTQGEFETRVCVLFAGACVERIRQDDLKHRMLAAPLELMEQRATLVAAQALMVSGRNPVSSGRGR